MKILVTMAGEGSRFRDVGVDKPKHQIPVKGKPMFDWAMKSLEQFFDEEFIFVTQSSHDPTPFLSNACLRLGIKSYQEVKLHEYTDGQATTAISADELIYSEDSVVIYNIDTYIEPDQLSPSDLSADGVIPVFKAPGERWSFVQEADDGTATKVSEKEKISNNATTGFYYFDKWELFKEAYEERSKSVSNQYGEKYVAPLYTHLIETDRTVKTIHVDRNSVHVLGTPTDLKLFDPGFEIPSNSNNEE